MRFGPVPLAEAEGAILAHSLKLPDGPLRKGASLTSADLVRVAAAGHAEVVAARLDPGDVGEDEAALRIAQALAPDPGAAGMRTTAANAGRVNLYAVRPGVLELDSPGIEAMNRLHPMITLATLPQYARTRDRSMIATVKIISYGVEEKAVDAAAEIVRGAIRVRPVKMKTAVLIQTDVGAGPGKGEAAMRERLNALGMTLSAVVATPHRVEPLADAIAGAQADLVLILTGSATSDPYDVAPQAVRVAGGEVTRFGMPVDPGNLLFLGSEAGRPVIGLPGCARSPALNGADWVLERTVCGIVLDDADFAAMGIGGLLKESPVRPLPRESARNPK